MEQPLEFRGSSTFLPDTIVFIPTEDTMQLEVNYIPGEETNWLNAQIYDGVGTDLLIGTITGGTITYPPMVTQAHLMTMVFSGTFLEDYLLISEYTGCTHQINVSANPSNGGSAQGGGTYNSGANCTVTATPNSNYSFVNWTENGTPVSSNTSYSFIVNDDRTLTANFVFYGSLEEDTTNDITIYPNPVKDIIHIEGIDLAKIEIVNTMGQLLISQESANSSVELNLRHLTPGIYLVKVYWNGGVVCHRLVKE